MEWIVFSYSLPTKASSSPRVTLWRRLRRLGAISPVNGVHLLPAREECVEAFQWLVQEVHHAQGDALMMYVARFDDLSEQQVIGLFQAARKEEYEQLDEQLVAVEQKLMLAPSDEDREQLRDMLERLRRRYSEIARVDYFNCPDGARIATRLTNLANALTPSMLQSIGMTSDLRTRLRDARWVTRPRPHVDRLACAWLIRRFINPDAAIRYSTEPETDEVAFDMAGGRFEHIGNMCTFEVMLQSFSLNEPALQMIAEIVHEIDLRDGLYIRPEIAGIDVVLQGWLLNDVSDQERETRGIALFEGLYAALATAATKGSTADDAA